MKLRTKNTNATPIPQQNKFQSTLKNNVISWEAAHPQKRPT